MTLLSFSVKINTDAVEAASSWLQLNVMKMDDQLPISYLK